MGIVGLWPMTLTEIEISKKEMVGLVVYICCPIDVPIPILHTQCI